MTGIADGIMPGNRQTGLNEDNTNEADYFYGTRRVDYAKLSIFLLVGYSKSGEMKLPMSLVLDKKMTFKTVFRYRYIYPVAIEAVASGKVNLKGIVTDIFPLDEAPKAMDYSIHNRADIVKAVIKICD